MQLSLSLAVALLACAEGMVSATRSFKLYAYGNDLPTGMRLFHVDGQAYLGNKAPLFAAEVANITLTLTDDLMFVASPEGDVLWPLQHFMYIGAEAGDMKSVGFVSKDSIPEDAIIKGFGLFGGWAYNNQKADAIEMNFVATPANETGLYQIKWNTASTTSAGDHVPISLRTAAPATPQG